MLLGARSRVLSAVHRTRAVSTGPPFVLLVVWSHHFIIKMPRSLVPASDEEGSDSEVEDVVSSLDNEEDELDSLVQPSSSNSSVIFW